MGGGFIQSLFSSFSSGKSPVPPVAEALGPVKKEVRFLPQTSSSAEGIQQLGVVDRSGSMASMRSELVEGRNVFMEEHWQRKFGPRSP